MPASRPNGRSCPRPEEDMRTYAELIRGDFEAYIADVQE